MRADSYDTDYTMYLRKAAKARKKAAKAHLKASELHGEGKDVLSNLQAAGNRYESIAQAFEAKADKLRGQE